MCVCLVFVNIIMFNMFKQAIVFYSKRSTNTQFAIMLLNTFTLHKLLDKDNGYCPFTWKLFIYPDDNGYSMGGESQMWILKNSRDMLEYVQSRSIFTCIKTFDFFTLYTTIPYSKLKDRLKDYIQLIPRTSTLKKDQDIDHCN